MTEKRDLLKENRQEIEKGLKELDQMIEKDPDWYDDILSSDDKEKTKDQDREQKLKDFSMPWDSQGKVKRSRESMDKALDETKKTEKEREERQSTGNGVIGEGYEPSASSSNKVQRPNSPRLKVYKTDTTT